MRGRPASEAGAEEDANAEECVLDRVAVINHRLGAEQKPAIVEQGALDAEAAGREQRKVADALIPEHVETDAQQGVAEDARAAAADAQLGPEANEAEGLRAVASLGVDAVDPQVVLEEATGRRREVASAGEQAPAGDAPAVEAKAGVANIEGEQARGDQQVIAVLREAGRVDWALARLWWRRGGESRGGCGTGGGGGAGSSGGASGVGGGSGSAGGEATGGAGSGTGAVPSPSSCGMASAASRRREPPQVCTYKITGLSPRCVHNSEHEVPVRRSEGGVLDGARFDDDMGGDAALVASAASQVSARPVKMTSASRISWAKGTSRHCEADAGAGSSAAARASTGSSACRDMRST